MADGKSLIGLAVLGVGGYFAYEYIFKGMLSALPAGGSGGSAAGGAGTSAAPNTGGSTGSGAGTNPVPASPPACSAAGSLAKILNLAQKANPTLKLGPDGTDTFTIDQWGFYGNQYCSGMMDQYGVNADTLFPGDPNRGGPLNWNAFQGFAQQKGLSGPIGTHLVGRRRRIAA